MGRGWIVRRLFAGRGPRIRRLWLLVAWLAVAPLGAGAAPGVEIVEELPEVTVPDGAIYGGSLFARRVQVATREVLSALRGSRGETCRDYFDELGVDLESWLSLEGPPYFKEVRGQLPRGLAAYAQAGAPFEWVFIAESAARSFDTCQLGSLLLHELGHLARRDEVDNEPQEFFSRCRLSGCIEAGRYR